MSELKGLEYQEKMLIQAMLVLQEQAEREKGCEYCNSGALDNLVLTNACGKPYVALHGGYVPISESEKPKFCPHCGKPLNWGDKS